MWDLVTRRDQHQQRDERRKAEVNHETFDPFRLFHLYPKDAKSENFPGTKENFLSVQLSARMQCWALVLYIISFHLVLLHILVSLNNISVILKWSFWASCSSKPTFCNWLFEDSIFSSALERTEILLVERLVSTLKNMNKMSLNN